MTICMELSAGKQKWGHEEFANKAFRTLLRVKAVKWGTLPK
jgi:hypothetical protein